MKFTLMAVVKSNGREIQFRGLFQVREVLVSCGVAQKFSYKKFDCPKSGYTVVNGTKWPSRSLKCIFSFRKRAMIMLTQAYHRVPTHTPCTALHNVNLFVFCIQNPMELSRRSHFGKSVESPYTAQKLTRVVRYVDH
jgi:hypothetical protein